MSKILVDADSIFFKIGYNDKATPAQLKKSYRRFLKGIATNNFTTTDDLIVLGERSG